MIKHRIIFKEINFCTFINQAFHRISHFIDTCLTQLTEMILNSCENRKYTCMYLIDLQNSFGTLDQKILLGKIKCIGQIKKWFYYINSLFRFIGQCVCRRRDHKHRSFKRTYIRTFMFLLYKNDIQQALSDTHKYLYPDNSNIWRLIKEDNLWQ